MNTINHASRETIRDIKESDYYLIYIDLLLGSKDFIHEFNSHKKHIKVLISLLKNKM